MGRPRVRAGEVATPERLLMAAEAEFAERGYDGARLADIAERAGISRPSLLYHYESKHALYCEVIRNVFGELGQALEAATEGATFSERLEKMLAHFVGVVRRRPTAARLILRELMDGRGPGQDLVLGAGVPLLAEVEGFIQREGLGAIRAGLPIREALLQVVTSTLLKSAIGPLESALWGKEDHSFALARLLLLEKT